MRPKQSDFSIRRQVLNDEAGAELFPLLADEQEMMLFFPEIWQTGEAGRMLYHAAELASMPPQHADIFRQIKRMLPTLRTHAAFFHDENPPEPRTTAAIWEDKRHWSIVAGIRDQNIRDIRALAAFRQFVGSFPEKLVFVYTEEERKNKEEMDRLFKEAGIELRPYESSFSSVREAAFDYEWNRRKPADADHRVEMNAWKVYEKLLAGTFLDDDALEEALHAPRTSK